MLFYFAFNYIFIIINKKGNMEALFENTTFLNRDDLYKYQKCEIKKSVWLASGLLLLFTIGISVPLALFVEIYLGAILLIIGAVCSIVLLPYIIADGIKKQNAQILSQADISINFVFFQDEFIVQAKQKESEKKARESYVYSQIIKVSLYDVYMFIYTSPNASLVLDRRNMTKGTSGDIIDLFKSHGVKVVDKTNARN